MKGVECPTCGSFARKEPGGIICQRGHCFLYQRILPRDHGTPDEGVIGSYQYVRAAPGWDGRNRRRQRALDRAYTHPARVEEAIFDMIEPPRRRA